MASNSNGSYTFYPEFSENVILYRGADEVILGNGTGGYKDGWLYIKFVDEVAKEMGPISAYALAVKNGYEGTQVEWVAELASSSVNAQQAKDARDTAIESANTAVEAKTQAIQAQNNAEAWATGGSNGTPSATNNALYYSTLASQALTGVQNSEAKAAAWATGSTAGEPSNTNNAKYYAGEAGDAAAEAQAWANGGSNGIPDSANNAKFYADQAHVWTTGSLTDGGTGGAQNSAKYFAGQAEQWATGNTGGTPGISNNAKYYADEAKSMRDQTVVYYEPMQQCVQQVSAAVGTVQDLTAEARGYAESADAQARKWAIGPGDDTTDETYENNAKHYAQVAKTNSDNIENVTTTTLYFLGSNSGVTPPPDDAEGWSPSLNNISIQDYGKYVWSKTTFTWGNNATSVVYHVGYLGANGTGSVDSVNSLAGDVVLDGSNIFFDANEQDQEQKKTLQQYINDLEIALQGYADAAGSVKDVNGVSPINGTVSLDASDIYVDKDEEVEEGESRQTLMDYITSIEPVYATDAQIDALFEEEVGA